MTPKFRSTERGAILIVVAVALLVLVGFSAIVVDYGILWVSRSQAQAAADAGALAGAISIAANAANPQVHEAALETRALPREEEDPRHRASTRARSSRRAVWMIFCSARRFTKPGSGMIRSKLERSA